jgi:Tol biopolymer transport system component
MMSARVVWLFVCSALALSVPMLAQRNPEDALREAIDTESLKGCRTAAPLYEKAATGANRSVDANALIRLAGCYESLGDSKARATYQRIERDYRDQPAAFALARTRLDAKGGEKRLPVVKRLICTDCDIDDVSRDGRWSVYADQSRHELVIRDVTTSRVVRRISTGPGAPRNARFSPDGGRIAFTSATLPAPEPGDALYPLKGIKAAASSTRTEIRVVPNRDGAQSTGVSSNASDQLRMLNQPIGWSSDSQSLIIWKLPLSDDPGMLTRLSLKTGTFEVIAPMMASNSALSPDGRYVVYATQEVSRETRSVKQSLRVLPTDKSSEMEIISVGESASSPVWTPDSAHILFSTASGLWSVPVREGKATDAPTLVRSDVRNAKAVAIRNGSYYYADQSSPSGVTSIVTMASGGSNSAGQPPVTVTRVVGSAASWSPDGTRIAIRRRPDAGVDPDVVVHAIKSGEEQVFRRRGLQVVSGTWFHNGTMLVSALRDDGQRWLYRLDPGTRTFTEIAAFGSEYMQQSHPVSLDDRTIYVVERDAQRYDGDSTTDPAFNRLAALDVAAGTRRLIFTLPLDGDIRSLQLSPDGARLAMAIQRRSAPFTTEMAVVSIDGTGYHVLGTGPDSRSSGYSVAWTRDGGNVLFSTPVERSSKHWQVMTVPASGGTAVFTGVEVNDRDQLLIALSPDGSQLAISGKGTSREFWALDNVLTALR